MSFNSPISAVDCAPVNPLSALAGHLTTASSSLVNVNVPHSVHKQSQPLVPLAQPTLHSVQHAPPPAHDPQFHAIYHHHQHQQQHGHGPSVGGMVDQFHAMSLQQQHHENEMRHLNAIHSAIVQPPSQSPSQWASEFHREGRAASPMAVQHHQPTIQHRPPLGMSISMPYMSQHHHPSMYNRPLYQPSPYMPQHHYQPSLPLSQSQAKATVSEIKDDNIMHEVYNQQADDAGYQQGVDSVNDQSQSFTNTFTNEQSQSMQSGFGGGLNSEMIEKLMTSGDPKWRNSKFLQFISKIKDGKIEFRDNQAIEREAGQSEENKQGQDWANEFRQSESQSQSSFPTGWAEDFEQREGLRPLTTSEEIAKMGAGWSAPINTDTEDEAVWNEEYRQLVNGSNETLTDEEKQWSDTFLNGAANNGFDINWSQALEQMQSQSQLQPDPDYQFNHSNNTYLNHPSPFEEGLRLLAAGQLNEAILAFEATVQLDPNHSEAWCQLGSAQAENENEREAIAALLKAVSLDPYNLQALLQLGVSYTNDLEESRALNYLATWLESNPDYQSDTIVAAKNSINEYSQFYGGSGSHSNLDAVLHGQVTAMFKEALRLHPTDSQLHTVLGVLYHLSNDFDQSIECFKTALKYSPDSAQLWNKLGATLANSNRSSEAVHAYHRALTLRPRYVRALANLAISYANQNAHDSACVYYLKCLQCNAKPEHIWSYLRISLAQMGKEQLVELTHRKQVELFKPFYDF